LGDVGAKKPVPQIKFVDPKPVPKLGPFATKPVDIASIGVKVKHRRYTVNLRSNQLKPLRQSMTLIGEGLVSPYGPVTLPAKSKQIANIPLQAAFFSFASPLIGVAEADNRDIDLSDPHLSFATLGGFMYFDMHLELVGVNSLYEGPGLYLAGPFPFGRSAIRQHLTQTGRLLPPTIGQLSSMGVKSFTWLVPGEKFEGEDGAEWQDGAFVYMYDDPNLDCFFRVVDAPADAEKGAATSFSM